MKKLVFLLLMAAGLAWPADVFAQMAPIFGCFPKQNSWYTWTGTAWSPGNTYYYTYGSMSGYPVVTADEMRMAGASFSRNQYTWVLHGQPVMTGSLTQNWMGSAWMDVTRSIVDYDFTDPNIARPIQMVSQMKMGENWTTILGQQYVWQVDSRKLVTSLTTSTYIVSEGRFGPAEKIMYVYDAYNRGIRDTVYHYSNSEWVYATLVKRYYPAQKDSLWPDSLISYQWTQPAQPGAQAIGPITLNITIPMEICRKSGYNFFGTT